MKRRFITIPIKMPVSTMIISNNEDKILLLRRSWSHKTYPRVWQLPEGKQKPRETNMNCAKRELYEETGIKCSLKYINTFSIYIKLFTIPIAHIERSVFTGVVNNSTVKLSHEHSDYRWITKEEINKLKLMPGTRKILQG